MNEYKNILTSTALIPLWAKAVEFFSSDPILKDDHAYEILQRLGYSLDLYDKKKQNPSQVGCCLRARWMDEETLRFIDSNPACQIIQLGAGLDDRFRRIGMPEGVIHWYDLDLDEVASMRRKVIPPSSRNEILGMDMFDTTWMKRLHKNNLPTLIIIEGVLMYIEHSQIQTLIENISSHLGAAMLLFDSVPYIAVGKAKFHDSVKIRDARVEYVWGIKNPESMYAISKKLRLQEFVYMSDLPQAKKFRSILRLMWRIPYFYRNANQFLVKAEIECSDSEPD